MRLIKCYGLPVKANLNLTGSCSRLLADWLLPGLVQQPTCSGNNNSFKNHLPFRSYCVFASSLIIFTPQRCTMTTSRYKLPFLFLLFITGTLFSQQKKIDSLQHLLAAEKKDSERINILWEISNEYVSRRPDSALLAAQQGLFISQKSKHKKGEIMFVEQMANVYQVTGNYSKSLGLYLSELKLAEAKPDADRTVVVLLNIANLYQLEGDYTNALRYAKKADSSISENKFDDYRWNSFSGFGDLYEKMDSIQKSFTYNELAYQLAKKENDSAKIGMSLNNTANIYSKAGKPDTALTMYLAAIPYLVSTGNESFLCETYQGIASIFFKRGKAETAIKYADKSFQIATTAGFDKKYIITCNLLTNIYKSLNKLDSAFYYQNKMITKKDAVYSDEKIRQLESLTIEEKLRQNELAEKLRKDEDNRKHNLQLLMIGIMIPLFFFLSMLLSKRKIKPKVVEFAGIFSLLLLFEYLALLLHPKIVAFTNDTPLLEIIILVIIAGVLTPAHHRIEKWMLHNLSKAKKHVQPNVVSEPNPEEEI